MNVFVKTLIIAGAGLFVGGNLSAVIPEKYQTILDRNAFGLLPPAPLVAETNKTAEPPANLKITGFATIAGERRVFFTIPPKDPAKELQQYISLSEGQREGTIEIVAIAEAEGEVRIRNGGVDMLLSLKKDGFQPQKVAPGMNQAPPMPLAPPPSPVASPVYSPESPGGNVVANPPAGPPVPMNPNVQNPEQINQQMNEQAGNVQNPQSTPSVRTIPTRTLRVPPVQQQPNIPGP